MKTLIPLAWFFATLLGGICLGMRVRAGEAALLMPSLPRQPDFPLLVLRGPQTHLIDLQPVTVHRDPFVAPIDDTGQSQIALTHQISDVGGSALVPLPASTVRRIILHGVIIGQPSYAMIDDGGRERVVGIGDPIDGGTVRSISVAVVELSNGVHLKVRSAP